MNFFVSVFFLFSATLIQLIFCPFTKVEESFNLHAIHDYLHQSTWKSFALSGDHSTFTGPIPRTFLGSIFIGFFTKRIVSLAKLCGLLNSKLGEQLIARAILGLINTSSISYFALCAHHVFGNTIGTMTLFLCALQFHLAFYASRTLPNMFAFPLVQVALGHFLVTLRRSNASARMSNRRRLLQAGSLLTLAAIVFRLEIVALLAPLTLIALISGSVSFWDVISRGFLVVFAALEITVPLDSYFWQKFTWPEGTSIYFNVFQGHASDWGNPKVMPWHFYLTNSLPKILGPVTFPLSIIGLALDRKTFLVGICAGVFVAAMSILSHKEWRFIVYIVPFANLSACVSINRMPVSKVVRWVFFALLGFLTIVQTFISSYASTINYPGGQALLDLHNLPRLANLTGIKVHIDNLAAQTGASRFIQLKDFDSTTTTMTPKWEYDKLSENPTESNFDVIICEKAIPVTDDAGFIIENYTKGFDRLQFEKSWPFFKVLVDEEKLKTYVRKSILT